MQENDYRLIFGNSDESKKKEMEYIKPLSKIMWLVS